MTNLVKLREAQGLRQEDVAKILGVSRQAYCTYENDKRQAGYETIKENIQSLIYKGFHGLFANRSPKYIVAAPFVLI